MNFVEYRGGLYLDINMRSVAPAYRRFARSALDVVELLKNAESFRPEFLESSIAHILNDDVESLEISESGILLVRLEPCLFAGVFQLLLEENLDMILKMGAQVITEEFLDPWNFEEPRDVGHAHFVAE